MADLNKLKPVHKVSYYSTNSKKIIDLCLGILGTIALFLINNKIGDALIYKPIINPNAFDIGCIVLYVVSVIYFVIVNRKFISFGLLAGFPIAIISWILIIFYSIYTGPGSW